MINLMSWKLIWLWVNSVKFEDNSKKKLGGGIIISDDKQKKFADFNLKLTFNGRFFKD